MTAGCLRPAGGPRRAGRAVAVRLDRCAAPAYDGSHPPGAPTRRATGSAAAQGIC